MSSDPVLVLTTVPDRPTDGTAVGETLARVLVEEALAACVNVLPPMQSVYRWKGVVESGNERQLVIKTTADRVPALETRLAQLHPYELPEFLVVSIAGGSEAYLDWIRQAGG